MIIIGQSALDWWRTPPGIKSAPLTPGMMLNYSTSVYDNHRRVMHQRKNACGPARLIGNRLFSDLKGVQLPVQVLVPHDASEPRNSMVRAHRMYRPIPEELLIDLGEGLQVVRPEVAAIQVACARGFYRVIELMFELTGLFCLFHPTIRAKIAAKELFIDSQENEERAEQAYSAATAYYDTFGEKVAYRNDAVDVSRDSQSWTPCIGRSGEYSGMYKRPPLVSCESLQQVLSELGRLHGIGVARRAAQFVHPGSGSPLETKMCMIACLPPRYGGESLPSPELNRRIAFDPQAANLAHMKSCVGDLVWSDKKVVLEVNGYEFHADRSGFKIESGREGALESMGYTVVDITCEQMSNEFMLDLKLERLSSALGAALQKRSERFLKERRDLLAALFH